MRNIFHEFAELCIEYGFSKKGKAYSRCIGDGIYQNLSIVSISKKSPYIKIGIWSMYSDLSPIFFNDRKNIGSYFPENLIGNRLDSSSFMGIQNEYEIMKQTGFSILDSITTQEQLLVTIYELQKIQYGSVLPHQIELCAPHILCGEYIEALNHLYGIYAQNWLNFHCKYDGLKNIGHFEEYIQTENDFEHEMESVTVFLHNLLGRKDRAINAYMLDCLKENIRLAKENDIAFAKNFFPKSIV